MHNMRVYHDLVANVRKGELPERGPHPYGSIEGNPNEAITYKAIKARQSSRHVVVSFAAKASDVLRFARVEPIARDDGGALRGFQRPADHGPREGDLELPDAA